MNSEQLEIQKVVKELKCFCEQNFFRQEAQVIVFMIIGTFSQSELLCRVHPRDIMRLNDDNFLNLFKLLKYLRESNQDVKALFGKDWLESIYQVVPIEKLS